MYRLRPIQMSDAKRMLEWMHDSSTMQYLRFDGGSRTIEDAKRFIAEAISDEYTCVHRAIVNQSDEYCGTVSLKNIRDGTAEFAIVLHPDSTGKGAGSQATRAILKEAFLNLSLDRVYLNVLHTNAVAIHLYEKEGFHFTGSTVEPFSDTYINLDWYEITRRDFEREPW